MGTFRHIILCLLFLNVMTYTNAFCISVYGQTTNTQNHSNAEQKERERVEKERYDEACKKGTLEGYDNFLALYPKSKYATDIYARKDDAIAFNKAKKLNTKEAYEYYLNKSQLLIYVSQAKKSLSELVAEVEWNKVKNSIDIGEMESFISKFPNSSYAKTANQRKKLILAIDAYEQEDYSLSLQLFNEIGEQIELLPGQKEIHMRVAEEVAFLKLTPNSSQIEYKEFIDKYPKGKYASLVSNWRAINYAKSLLVTDSESKYAIVRSYARDDKTRSLVEQYIVNNERNKTAYYNDLKEKKKEQEKKQKQYYKEQEKSALKILRELNDDWKLINFGVGLFDLKSNYLTPYIEGDSDPIYLALHHLGFPISIKIGSNRETLQFEVGLKPSIVISHIIGLSDIPFTEDINTNVQYKFHMPAFTRIKLSIVLRDPVNLYLSGFASYNKLVGNISNETPFSAGGGIGFAWIHWDWTLLYYQQNIGNKTSQNIFIPHWDQMLGTSLVYYF